MMRHGHLVQWLLVVGIGLGVVFSPTAFADLQQGLVGHWSLDEGKGDKVGDDSGNGHEGFFAEGAPKWVQGKFGQALEFDGVSKVEIPDHEAFHLTDAVSVALWSKPEGGQPDWAKFFIKQKSGEYPYSLQFDNAQAIFATVNASARFDTAPKLPNFEGEWAHLCFTYDGEAIILYKDGVEVARNDDANGELQQNDLSLSIGGRLGSGQNLIGTIDEVYLYNRPLKMNEIQLLMEGGSGAAVNPYGRLVITWAVLKTR